MGIWNVGSDILDFIEVDKLVESIGGNTEKAVNAWNETSLVPQNIAQYFKFKYLGDDTFDESEVSDFDMKKLRGIASQKIKNNTTASGIGYKDYGVDEKKVLKDNKFAIGMKSMFDSNLRLATLLGRADISIEDDGVYVVDTYNFNTGTKRNKHKALIDAGKTEEASKFLDSLETLERESIEGYINNPTKSTKDGVKLFLGTVADLTT